MDIPEYLVLFFVVIFSVAALSKAVIIVPNQTAFVVERLGKFHATLGAGFHLLIPFIDRIAYRRGLKEEVLDVARQTCITRDNVSVDIDGVLYLQVLVPEKSAYGISDYKFGAVQLAQTAMRSAIGRLELDKTFEERTAINQEVVSALNDATFPWGVKVLRYEIRDISPPKTVMEAMEKQMRAEREKRAVIAQSEGEMQSRVNLAEGAKKAAIAESEGHRQAVINQAEAEAARILKVAAATAEGLEIVGEKMEKGAGVAAAQLHLAEAYIAEFGKLAQRGNTLIIPADAANVAGMVAAMTKIVGQGTGLAASSCREPARGE
jgi:regulator of protease activity HflC (stomatin/prohibitin superfamily)